jgi:tripartite-type tricarboxylate transporter receptor subunit TctC
MMLRKGLSWTLAIVTSGLFMAGIALAQPYPYRPIRIIVPFAAGGAADISTRVVAPRLQEALGQQIVVDNRPGAGSIIGSDLLAKAAGDGYTLMMANVSFSANPALHSKLPYDTAKDFVSIGLVDLMPNVLLVHPCVPARSVAELIALAKAKPGQLNYASAGVGSANYLNTELLKNDIGLNVVHVPYQGGGQAMTAILGGETQMLFITVPPALPHIKSGRVRVLAATSAKRLPTLPEVPTIAETVLPGFTFHEWHGVLAPAGTPKAVIGRLNREINTLLTVPEVRERIAGMGAEVTGSTPEQMTQYVQSEIRKWTKALKPVD